jgi:hypothetical protein
MRRRSFLALLALALLSPLLGRAKRAPRETLATTTGWSPRARASAARIGEAYLEDHPEEAQPALLARLLREAGLEEAPGPTSRARARIREDFERGRTVQVDGWVLSRTEARLCALTALTT